MNDDFIEREAFAAFLLGDYSDVYTKRTVDNYIEHDHISWLAWQARAAIERQSVPDLNRLTPFVSGLGKAILQELIEDLAAAPQQEPVQQFELTEYDAGLLNDFGGGNVEWWQDYIRAELGRAYEHYQSQSPAPQPQPLTKEWIAALVEKATGANSEGMSDEDCFEFIVRAGNPAPDRRPTNADERWRTRQTIWDVAQRSLTNLQSADTPQMRSQIIETAVARGGFAIWFTVFRSDADMRQRLIAAFPGTATDCFDGVLEACQRPGGNL